MTTEARLERPIARSGTRSAFRTTKVRVRKMGADAYQVHLEGTMRPGWAGSIASGLAKSGITIDRVYAVRASDGAWRAELDVRRSPEGQSPEHVAYAALVGRDADGDASTPFVIERFELAPSRAHGGALALTVHAKDALGFLGALLGRLAFLSLFPAELRIETHGERVFDRLWLTGVAGGTPSSEARAMLAQMLERALPSSDDSRRER